MGMRLVAHHLRLGGSLARLSESERLHIVEGVILVGEYNSLLYLTARWCLSVLCPPPTSPRGQVVVVAVARVVASCCSTRGSCG